jgi:hypothetical protein
LEWKASERTLTIAVGTLDKCNHTDARSTHPQVLIQNANTVKKSTKLLR